MCLIIASPNGTVPTCGVIERGWKDNSDGWGLMQSDGSEVIVNKGLRFNDLKGLLDNLNGNPYVLHYRWATHGTKNIDNCHPFRITKKLYMAHNGVIAIEQKNKLMSDTWHYAQELRRLGVDHDNVQDEELKELMSTWIGGNNKLAFLDHTGKVTLVNENAGTWKDEIWYSNTYSLYDTADLGWESYLSSRYKYSGGKYGWRHSHRSQQQSEPLLTEQDCKTWEDGTDLWDNCEYCNTLDWLEEVATCDGMHLCVPCKKVLTPLFAEEAALPGLNAGLYYDSNGIPYSWDDVDDAVVRTRNAYEFNNRKG